MRNTTFRARGLLALAGVLLAACARAASQREAPHADAAVRAVERLRFDAMVARDLRALDTLLADDLTYTHTTGRVDDKRALLADLDAGRLVYDSIVPSDVRIRVYGARPPSPAPRGCRSAPTARCCGSARASRSSTWRTADAGSSRCGSRRGCREARTRGGWRAARGGAFRGAPAACVARAAPRGPRR